ncbi:MAG: oligopeptide/dipeptide ABC transporter ATP-binding protein [Rhodothermales bacterium]
MALVEARGLKKDFDAPGRGRKVTAVDDVSLLVEAGEVVGLVGESGSGKSTVGRLLLRLLEPTAGEIRFRGQDIGRLEGEALRPFRRHMQMVFQDPYASLNGRMRVREILEEPLRVHRVPRVEWADRIEELLRTVGLGTEVVSRFPHEFSGGQRQRIGIARALAVEPSFIVADEPVSSLDVSVQAQVLNLLADLRGRLGLAMLFIAHDLAVVRHVADRVLVMYLGRIVEEAEAHMLFANPVHPYTEALLSAAPVPEVGVRRDRIVLQGDIPSPMAIPSGCAFRSRCHLAEPRCAEERPPLEEVNPGHWKACWVR